MSDHERHVIEHRLAWISFRLSTLASLVMFESGSECREEIAGLGDERIRLLRALLAALESQC